MSDKHTKMSLYTSDLEKSHICEWREYIRADTWSTCITLLHALSYAFSDDRHVKDQRTEQWRPIDADD